MSLGKVVRRCMNVALHPLRWEVVKAPKQRNGRFQMQDALARARGHQLDVRTIIDVGASDGRWSRHALSMFPEATSLAFEPLAEREAALQALRARQPRFDYVLACAGDEVGTARLNVAGDLDGSAIDLGGGGESRLVPVTTIDHAIQDRQLPGPYLLKLDTHGFELPILSGAEQTLRAASLVLIEVYNFNITPGCLRFHEMCGHMESLGFRCFDLVDPMLRPSDQAFWQMDIFFAREDSPIFANSRYQ